jgi:hypothetical protein
MTKRKFELVHEIARQRAAAHCLVAPHGQVVRFSEPAKKREQEERYHAMIGEIAKAWLFMGRKWSTDDCKRILVDAFAKVMRDAGTPLHHDGLIVPSIDGQRVVQLGIQTRHFYVKEASEFIEFLFAFAAENGVTFSDNRSAA